MNKKSRIANIGIRSIPFRAGCSGGDKVALEYCSRLVKRGFRVVVYNRVYDNEDCSLSSFNGINLIYLNTVRKAGFDTLVHSAKATFHVIRHDTADVVLISNGGNSIWGLFLRLFGKKVIVWVDGVDWKRGKWPWYGKAFLYFSAFLTSAIPHKVIFDNVFAKEMYEKRFHKPFEFLKNGVDVVEFKDNKDVLGRFGLVPGQYILFVGRFIPDKGLHYLIPAFKQIQTSMKLILIGGSPNRSEYEHSLMNSGDPRIITPGYLYGDDVFTLMKHAYLYVQPSDVEGLSPVIQEVMALGTPLLCSNIRENLFVTGDTAQTFQKGNIEDLRDKIVFALENELVIRNLAERAKERVLREFSWEKALDHLEEIIESV